MKYFFSSVILFLSLVAFGASKKNNDLKILTWEQLSRLPADDRIQYVSKLTTIISHIGMKKAQAHFLLELLQSEARAEEEANCVAAGTAGRLDKEQICRPLKKLSQTICGREVKCEVPGKIPCDPFLFGYQDAPVPGKPVVHISPDNTQLCKGQVSTIEMESIALARIRIERKGSPPAKCPTGMFQRGPDAGHLYVPVYTKPFCITPTGANRTAAGVESCVRQAHGIADVNEFGERQELPSANEDVRKKRGNVMAEMYKNLFSRYDAGKAPEACQSIPTQWNERMQELRTVCRNDVRGCGTAEAEANALYNNFIAKLPGQDAAQPSNKFQSPSHFTR